MTALPVNNNQSANVTVSISNGPTNVTFLTPTGNCTSFPNVNSVNCQTDRLTFNKTLSARLANGNSCSQKICVLLKQPAYRIWNTTGQRRYFQTPNGGCRLVNNGKEITQSNNRLTPGTRVTGYTSSTGCQGEISYVDYTWAACTDDNGDGWINYNADGSTSDR
jgi:hypothetical protein